MLASSEAAGGGSALVLRRWLCGQVTQVSLTRQSSSFPLNVHIINERGSTRGVQPFGISVPHWKKSCLGPHIKYIVTHNHKTIL